MKQGNIKSIWNLESGYWSADSKYGYTLDQVNERKVDFASNRFLSKQLLGASISNGKIYPPEFKFDPETGEKLTFAKDSNSDVWLPPLGKSVNSTDSSQGDSHNGLQLSRQLRKIKHVPENISDQPQKEIRREQLKGYFEFLSIHCSTKKSQLIALSKNKAEIFILHEHENVWLELHPQSARLAECSDSLLQYWQVVAFYDESKMQHQIYLPTKQGLARLTIDGLSLTYHVEYIVENCECLGSPVYWNQMVLTPILLNGKLNIIDGISKKIIYSSEKIEKAYFVKAVYDTKNLIWIGDNGQLILSPETNGQNISVKHQYWLPVLKPDFRFGAPFFDNFGHFYQLCHKEETYCYVRLNLDDTEQKFIASSFRFTTGHIAYNFENKVKGSIWEESGHSVDNQKILVPLIEDRDKGLVLGFQFESNLNEAIDQKLTNTKEQDIVLFLDSHEKFTPIHRVSVRNPLESRFFYHQDHLYFYNPSLGNLLGWEVE